MLNSTSFDNKKSILVASYVVTQSNKKSTYAVHRVEIQKDCYFIAIKGVLWSKWATRDILLLRQYTYRSKNPCVTLIVHLKNKVQNWWGFLTSEPLLSVRPRALRLWQIIILCLVDAGLLSLFW